MNVSVKISELMFCSDVIITKLAICYANLYQKSLNYADAS